jgi:hypothetical protein
MEEDLHSILRKAGLLVIRVLERYARAVGKSKVGILEVAVNEQQMIQVGRPEIGIIEVGGGKIAIPCIDPHEIRVYQQRLRKVAIDELGTSKHRMPTIATTE